MDDFNFKSQICTSREQSERLLALGLKKETADCYWYNYNPADFISENWINCIGTDYGSKDIPAWSLHRLIEMTKLKVTPFLYGVEISHPQWQRAFVKRANV